MKNLWQNIFIGIFYLYIMVAATIFVPYYNWNYAKTHGFVKWICFGEVVATAKAVVWPYYAFSSTPVNRHDSPDAEHFINSKKAYEEAVIIVKKVGDVTKLPTGRKTEFAGFLRLAIAQANKVQPLYLQESHRDYPSMYDKKYKHGINLMLQGIETDNMALILEGAYECNEFSDWIYEHKSEFSL